MAADSRRAVGRLQNSAQHPDHGCFPRTVWAEKTEDRSFSDRKRNMVNRRESAEALRQPFHFDHWISHSKTELGMQEIDSSKVFFSWFPGFLGSWVPGFLGSWVPGFLGSWVPDSPLSIPHFTLGK